MPKEEEKEKRKVKMIRISPETHKQLTELGSKKETYNGIIQRTITGYKKFTKSEEKKKGKREFQKG